MALDGERASVERTRDQLADGSGQLIDPKAVRRQRQLLAGIGLADDRLGQRGDAELSSRQVTLIQPAVGRA